MKRIMSVKLFTLFSLLLIVPIAVLAGETPPEPVLRLNFEQCEDGLYIGPGAYGGVACQPAKFGTAADFDGKDDGVEIDDSPDYHFTDALTLAAWVRPDTISGLNTIVNKWYAMDSYMLLIEDGKFVFVVAFPGGTWGTTVSVEAPAVAGKWTHVAGVYDGSSIMLYLNGKMVSSAKASGDIQQSTRPISAGNHPSWNAYDGLIDEVRIYDTALTQLQVQELASTIPNPDFFVVFPRDHTLTVNINISNGSLALIWYDADADAEAGQIYKVLISEDQLFNKPICTNWISNVKSWVLNNWIIEEIGLESGATYYWKVEKSSQGQGGVISTDIASFAYDFSQGQHIEGGGDPGWLWGKVSGSSSNVYVSSGDTLVATLIPFLVNPHGIYCYIGIFHPGNYCARAGGKEEAVTIAPLGITRQNF
jgi:hypothetical protein